MSQTFPVPVNSVGSANTVTCPAGTGVISGGVVADAERDTWIDAPVGNGWSGAANNYGGMTPGEVTVNAVCAQAAQAPTGSEIPPSANVGAHRRRWAPTLRQATAEAWKTGAILDRSRM